MLRLDHFLQSHFQFLRVSLPLQGDCSTADITTRERVGILVQSVRCCFFRDDDTMVHWIVFPTVQRDATTTPDSRHAPGTVAESAQDTAHTRKDQPLVRLSHVQMCTQRFTVPPVCKQGTWKCMLCMRTLFISIC